MPRAHTLEHSQIEGLENRTFLSATPAEVIARAIDRLPEETTQRLLERARINVTALSQTAFAEFDSTNASGVETFAQFSATKDFVSTSNSGVSLTLAVKDASENPPQLAAFGSSPLSSSTTVRFDGLSRASAAGTVEVTDAATLESFPAAFNLQWAASGKLTTSHTIDIQADTLTISLGQSRAATAKGQITAPGTTTTPLSGNLTPVSSTVASLETTATFEISTSAAQRIFGAYVRWFDRVETGPLQCQGRIHSRLTILTKRLSDLSSTARLTLANELLNKLAGSRR